MIHKIISLLEKNKSGLSVTHLVQMLNLASKDRNQLRRTLKRLERLGLVAKKRRRFILLPRSKIVRGTWVSSFRGYGFVAPENRREDDIFVPNRFSGGALPGDVVELITRKSRREGDLEGQVVRIIAKKKKTLIGELKERNGRLFFLSYEKPFSDEIPLDWNKHPHLSPGMVIEVERDTHRLIKAFGFQDEPGVDASVVIQKFRLRDTFPEEVLSEAAKISGRISNTEKARRTDHRDWVSFTIDGEDAQDFDDAVSIRSMKNNGFQLGVHIADVSHYVKPGEALDQEAYFRGTSVYFPGMCLPMLPERLSNDLCSLRPQKERLTVTVLMEFDKNGTLFRSEFYPSVIQTKARMTYDAVFQILQGDSEQQDRYKKIVPDLVMMQKLACLLREKRMKQGGLDFDLPEPELVYHSGILHSVVPGETNEAHQMIEEFMIKANETVAQYLAEKGPMVFRIHPPPAPQDIEELRKRLSHFRIILPPAKQIKSKALSDMIRSVKEKTIKKYISLQVLKSLRWAEYSDVNNGHFGLGKIVYTHFTSPIRRYPDLVVHRILKRAIKNEGSDEGPLKKLTLHCSDCERRADEAEKELVEWRIFRFLKKQKLGEVIQGMIVDISKSGFAVELEDYSVEGYVPAMDLHLKFDFWKAEQQWSDRKSGRTFRLGDRVCLQLASVDTVNRRIKMVFPDFGGKERK